MLIYVQLLKKFFLTLRESCSVGLTDSVLPGISLIEKIPLPTPGSLPLRPDSPTYPRKPSRCEHWIKIPIIP